MRLHLDTGSLVNTTSQTAATPSTGRDAAAASKTGSSSPDSIGLSGTSAALNQFAQDRTARIQNLTAAVQGGTYQVSGTAISSALVTASFA